MTTQFALQPDENVLAKLTCLLDYFDGTQNIYFGDLLLTNKRLSVVGKKPSIVEESLWFGDEMRDIGASTIIVGENSIKVRWIYKGNLSDFVQKFQDLNVHG